MSGKISATTYSNRKSETVCWKMSIVTTAVILLTVPLIAQQLSALTRVADSLRDAAILEHLVAVSSAVADVARKVRDEEFSDNQLSFTTGPSALRITVVNSISEVLTDPKLAGEWELPPYILHRGPTVRGFCKALERSVHTWAQLHILVSYLRPAYKSIT